MNERGTLSEKEPHPAFRNALDWYNQQTMESLSMWMESFSSCAIEGNRLAEVCAETLRRLMNGEPVSDRYFLGLCWTMRYDKMTRKERKRKSNPS